MLTETWLSRIEFLPNRSLASIKPPDRGLTANANKYTTAGVYTDYFYDYVVIVLKGVDTAGEKRNVVYVVWRSTKYPFFQIAL